MRRLRSYVERAIGEKPHAILYSLIDGWKAKKLRCENCGTTRSVKYSAVYEDSTEGPWCNICATTIPTNSLVNKGEIE